MVLTFPTVPEHQKPSVLGRNSSSARWYEDCFSIKASRVCLEVHHGKQTESEFSMPMRFRQALSGLLR
jgi:hypothetical protein